MDDLSSHSCLMMSFRHMFYDFWGGRGVFGHWRVLLWLCLWKYDDIIVFTFAWTISERKFTFKYILHVLMCFNSMVFGWTLLITSMMQILCSLCLFIHIAFFWILLCWICPLLMLVVEAMNYQCIVHWFGVEAGIFYS